MIKDILSANKNKSIPDFRNLNLKFKTDLSQIVKTKLRTQNQFNIDLETGIWNLNLWVKFLKPELSTNNKPDYIDYIIAKSYKTSLYLMIVLELFYSTSIVNIYSREYIFLY